MEETKRREMPRGVGSGVGRRVREVESEGSGAGGGVFEGLESDSVECVSSSGGVSLVLSLLGWEGEGVGEGAMAMAVDMRCAITHPMIFSLCVLLDDEEPDERRNRYALDALSVWGVSAGADNVMLTDSRSVVSYI